jgi:hypothetical protein
MNRREKFNKYGDEASEFVGQWLAIHYAARFVSKLVVYGTIVYLVYKYVL